MPIPEFDRSTGNLPEGIHDATWDEVGARFGGPTLRRRDLFVNLGIVLGRFQRRGVRIVLIDGSFVTRKERPKDVDVIYLPPAEADPMTWGPESPASRFQIERDFKVQIFAYPSMARHFGLTSDKESILDVFTRDRSNAAKGIVRVDLGGMP